MDVIQLVGIGATLAWSACVQSALGFGFALFAVPMLLFLDIPLDEAVPLVLICALGQVLFSTYQLRRAIPWRKVAPLGVLGIAGMLPGLLVLAIVKDLDRAVVRQAVGGVVLVILLVKWLWRIQPRDQVHPLWGAVALLTGGFLGGITGMAGPPIVLWAMAHNWSNQQTRGTLFALFVCIIVVQLPVMAMRFPEAAPEGMIGVLFVPLVIVATMVGLKIGHRFSKPLLARLVLGLLAAMAGWAMVAPWLIRGLGK